MRNLGLTLSMTLLVACGDGNRPSEPEAGSFGADLNAFRALEGEGPLRTHPRLEQAAQAHAEYILRTGNFSHRSPGGPNGDTMSERIASTGCRAGAAAENIAQGQSSERAVIAAWRGSTGHRANMLGAGYTVYGLGRAGDTWVLVLSDGC